MALQSSEVYYLLREVFSMFKQLQQHKLKDAELQKALQGESTVPNCSIQDVPGLINYRWSLLNSYINFT